MSLPEKIGAIGIDETGIGSLCGPIIACGVLLEKPCTGTEFSRVRDSKKVGRAELLRVVPQLKAHLKHCVLQASSATVNKHGTWNTWELLINEIIFRMRQQYGATLPVILDGSRIPPGQYLLSTMVKGDAKLFNIAAASMIAKYHRVRIMSVLSNLHPAYGLESSDGYGTAKHIDAIREHGLTAFHRAAACQTALNTQSLNKMRASIKDGYVRR